MIFEPNGDFRSPKCACFDMDGTIIKNRSGKKFPENYRDWMILYSGKIPEKLHELHRNGYRIVIFSNQRGLATGKQSKPDLKLKFTAIMKKIGVPMTMFLSYGLGVHRKPSVGLWHLLEEQNGPIDKSKSFYVGDAAGRPKNWQPGAAMDHSKVDRLFALNLDINFYTPEEYFLKSSKNKFEMPVFNPKELRKNRTLGVVVEPESEKKEIGSLEDLVRQDLEMLVLVGYPASGKSTLAQIISEKKGYIQINQDTLGSLDRCVRKAGEALSNKKSVIIDNTNFLEEQRRRYIEIARRAGANVRCLWLDCSVDQARHNNKFRLLTSPDAKHKDVTDVVLYTLRKKFEEPKLGEGFLQIVKMHMVPKFDTPQREKLFYMYLLEK
ncbi:uncharacterized protein F21D5.5 [Galendromus occidentalis]|uniref:Uncharacterized protein F21D5.5 n=1 Tax=Galendromus occidentalis TaxID=34638 RepID=A0AAJ7L7H8_9ACAR|nr:uncharacterized protein F21D5.5 [Galendromus occidentalis]